jgi:hypothetical protein
MIPQDPLRAVLVGMIRRGRVQEFGPIFTALGWGRRERRRRFRPCRFWVWQCDDSIQRFEEKTPDSDRRVNR